jgi:hypothetical protein
MNWILPMHVNLQVNFSYSINKKMNIRFSSMLTENVKMVLNWPVTVAKRSKAFTVFVRSEAGIMFGVCVFILCLCYPVFR